MFALNLIPKFGLFYTFTGALNNIILIALLLVWSYGLFVLTIGTIKKVKNKNNV